MTLYLTRHSLSVWLPSTTLGAEPFLWRCWPVFNPEDRTNIGMRRMVHCQGPNGIHDLSTTRNQCAQVIPEQAAENPEGPGVARRLISAFWRFVRIEVDVHRINEATGVSGRGRLWLGI